MKEDAFIYDGEERSLADPERRKGGEERSLAKRRSGEKAAMGSCWSRGSSGEIDCGIEAATWHKGGHTKSHSDIDYHHNYHAKDANPTP